MVSKKKLLPLLLALCTIPTYPMHRPIANMAYYSLATLPSACALGSILWARKHIQNTLHPASYLTTIMVRTELAKLGIKNPENIVVKVRYQKKENSDQQPSQAKQFWRELTDFGITNKLKQLLDVKSNIAQKLLKGSRTIVLDHDIKRLQLTESERAYIARVAKDIENNTLRKRIIKTCVIPCLSHLGTGMISGNDNNFSSGLRMSALNSALLYSTF